MLRAAGRRVLDGATKEDRRLMTSLMFCAGFCLVVICWSIVSAPV